VLLLIAIILGVPAMVAGYKEIIFTTPPCSDSSVTPEIMYITHKVGVESINLAGGAHAAQLWCTVYRAFTR
jgi:phosphoribosyl-ATP pyrophosphohydrolase/phosphoribosyl-AMP cyclohydrolase/histidinol dehydrogenase